jgi:DNA polymerase III delta prime subunit
MNNDLFPLDMPPVTFANARSEQNFRALLSGALRSEYHFQPMLLISGPPGSGKTKLAEWYLRHLLGVRCRCVISASESERALSGEIPCALKAGYLFLDDISKRVCNSNLLTRLLTASVWGYRVLGTHDRREVTVDLHVVATAVPGLVLSPQMFRRTVVVELNALRPRFLDGPFSAKPKN